MVTTSSQAGLRPVSRPQSRQRNAQILALITMASFGMLFGTFLLSFLLAQARNANWPPIGVASIDKVYACLSTGVILASSLLYMHARKSQLAGNISAAKWTVVATWGLAAIFLLLQYFTLKGLWTQGQSLSSDIYSGSVFVLIGLHALHLLGGLGGLTYIAIALFFFRGPVSDTAMQIVGWFWHFLGLLWGLIFLVLVL